MPKPKTNLFCGPSFFKKKKKDKNESVPAPQNKTEDDIATNLKQKIREANELYASLHAIRLYERHQDKDEAALTTIYHRSLLELTDEEIAAHKETRDLFLETLVESEAATHLFSIYMTFLNGDLATKAAVQNAMSAKKNYEDFKKNMSSAANALHRESCLELKNEERNKSTVKPVEIAIKLNGFATSYYQKIVKEHALNRSDKEKLQRFQIYKYSLTEEQKREYDIRSTEIMMRKPLEDGLVEPLLYGLFWDAGPSKQYTDTDLKASSLSRWNW